MEWLNISFAKDFLESLPYNTLYKTGEIVYPPRGMNDIAVLMAAFYEHMLKNGGN